MGDIKMEMPNIKNFDQNKILNKRVFGIRVVTGSKAQAVREGHKGIDDANTQLDEASYKLEETDGEVDISEFKSEEGEETNEEGNTEKTNGETENSEGKVEKEKGKKEEDPITSGTEDMGTQTEDIEDMNKNTSDDVDSCVDRNAEIADEIKALQEEDGDEDEGKHGNNSPNAVAASPMMAAAPMAAPQANAPMAAPQANAPMATPQANAPMAAPQAANQEAPVGGTDITGNGVNSAYSLTTAGQQEEAKKNAAEGKSTVADSTSIAKEEAEKNSIMSAPSVPVASAQPPVAGAQPPVAGAQPLPGQPAVPGAQPPVAGAQPLPGQPTVPGAQPPVPGAPTNDSAANTLDIPGEGGGSKSAGGSKKSASDDKNNKIKELIAESKENSEKMNDTVTENEIQSTETMEQSEELQEAAEEAQEENDGLKEVSANLKDLSGTLSDVSEGVHYGAATMHALDGNLSQISNIALAKVEEGLDKLSGGLFSTASTLLSFVYTASGGTAVQGGALSTKGGQETTKEAINTVKETASTCGKIGDTLDTVQEGIDTANQGVIATYSAMDVATAIQDGNILGAIQSASDAYNAASSFADGVKDMKDEIEASKGEAEKAGDVKGESKSDKKDNKSKSGDGKKSFGVADGLKYGMAAMNITSSTIQNGFQGFVNSTVQEAGKGTFDGVKIGGNTISGDAFKFRFEEVSSKDLAAARDVNRQNSINKETDKELAAWKEKNPDKAKDEKEVEKQKKKIEEQKSKEYDSKPRVSIIKNAQQKADAVKASINNDANKNVKDVKQQGQANVDKVAESGRASVKAAEDQVNDIKTQINKAKAHGQDTTELEKQLKVAKQNVKTAKSDAKAEVKAAVKEANDNIKDARTAGAAERKETYNNTTKRREHIKDNWNNEKDPKASISVNAYKEAEKPKGNTISGLANIYTTGVTAYNQIDALKNKSDDDASAVTGESNNTQPKNDVDQDYSDFKKRLADFKSGLRK